MPKKANTNAKFSLPILPDTSTLNTAFPPSKYKRSIIYHSTPNEADEYGGICIGEFRVKRGRVIHKVAFRYSTPGDFYNNFYTAYPIFRRGD